MKNLILPAMATTALCLLAASFCCAKDLDPRPPHLRPLLDWVTFYQSFDHSTAVPDMAAGEWKVSVHGKPELADGLSGKALVAGTGAVMYPGVRNWTIATRGAVSFWLCPVHWDHRNAGNTNFLLSGSSALYLERQGPLYNQDGQLQRGEVLLFGLQQGPTGNAAAACSHWKDGEWHLIVANWSWPRIELSVDGSDFAGVELRGKPDSGLFGDFMLGSVGGDPTLMDEVMLYRRPLTVEDARNHYKALRPRK